MDDLPIPAACGSNLKDGSKLASFPGAVNCPACKPDRLALARRAYIAPKETVDA
jgi:hypothetical protein